MKIFREGGEFFSGINFDIKTIAEVMDCCNEFVPQLLN